MTTTKKSTYREQAEMALSMMSIGDAVELVHNLFLEQVDINGMDEEELASLRLLVRAFDVDVEDLLMEARK